MSGDDHFIRPDNDRDDRSLRAKALEMRDAIDHMEGALMGLGTFDPVGGLFRCSFADLPRVFENARDDLIINPKMTVGQMRRVCSALEELTRIVNDEGFAPGRLA